jgi:hypothetical protein
MWLLFDMTKCCILNAAPEARQLRFEEDELPPHLQKVMSSRVEAIDDPLFLGVRSVWPEIKLRYLYTWLKIEPALPPSKMDEVQIVTLRIRIRAAIATQLRFEPKKLPILEAYLGPVSAPPAAPPPPRLPPAQRGAVGPLIHRVATEMWEAEGKPMDPGVILQLRRRIMTALLDDHKIKTSTSSNELGRWQKQLVSL